MQNSVLWLFLRDTSVNDERWKDKAGTHLDNSNFVPERWLADDTKQSSFTFGQGPRSCLGMHAAQLEMKVGPTDPLSGWRSWCCIMPAFTTSCERRRWLEGIQE